MKLTTPPRKKKRFAIIVIVVLLIISSVVAALYYSRTPNNSPQTPPETDQIVQSPEEKKQSSETKREFLERYQGTEDPGTPLEPPTSNDSLSLSAEQQNSNVVIYTTISNVSGGSCKLTARNGNANHEQTAEIIYAHDGSSCAGFTIEVSRLGAGNWDVSLEVFPVNGSVLTKSISIKVVS